MTDAAVIVFRIPGRLRAWARMRVNATQPGKPPVQFMDKEVAAHMSMVREIASRAMGTRRLLRGPIAMWVIFSIHHPKSWTKAEKLQRYVTARPDTDNRAKLIMDACNRIVYEDDAQVAELHAKKIYDDDVPECVTIKFMVLEQEPAALPAPQQTTLRLPPPPPSKQRPPLVLAGAA